MKPEIILNERQKTVLEEINKSDFISIRELAEKTNVSEATIRRDLDSLSDGGYIGRVHGGAVRLPSTAYERFQSEKIKLMADEKQRIAEAAAAMVKDGNSIFLDSGTTTLFIANALADKKNLTVVTDNLNIAYAVQFDSSSNVLLTGGLCRRDYSTVVGALTEEAIKHFRVDLTFVGCDAINPKTGLYNVNYLEIGVKREIVLCGAKTILVADHSKFNSTALAFICPMEQIDCIITDTGLDEKSRAIIRKQGIELILV